MLFDITKEQEVKIVTWLKYAKIPHTKILPVRYGGFVYNMRRINEAAKKANKRGGSTITQVRITEKGVLLIDYSERGSRGVFYLNPERGFDAIYDDIPLATTTFEIKKEKVTA